MKYWKTNKPNAYSEMNGREILNYAMRRTIPSHILLDVRGESRSVINVPGRVRRAFS